MTTDLTEADAAIVKASRDLMEANMAYHAACRDADAAYDDAIVAGTDQAAAEAARKKVYRAASVIYSAATDAIYNSTAAYR